MANITFSIPVKLLENVEKHVEGRTRNDKLIKCIKLGLETPTLGKRA